MNYSDIVPMEIQHRLLAARENIRGACFDIGDAVNEIIDMAGTNYPVEEIHKAVGMFSGKAARTVREYAHIAAVFDYEARYIYDVLSFDHFRHAARMGNRMYMALGWCLDQVDELGRPATVDALMAKFANAPAEVLVIQEFADDVPQAVQIMQRTAVGIFQAAIRSISDLITARKLPVNQEVYLRIEFALAALQDALAELEVVK